MSLVNLISSQALIRAVSSQEPPKKLTKPVSIALGILAVSAVVVYHSPGLRAGLREIVWKPVVNRCIDAWVLFFLRVDEGDRFRQMGPGVLDGVNGWERARMIHLAAEEGWSRAELRALIEVRQDLRQRVEEAIRDLDPQETRAPLINILGHWYRHGSAYFETWEALSAENKRDVMAAFTVLRQGNQGANNVGGNELVELMETPFGQRRKIAELVATLYRSNSVYACRGFMKELVGLDSDEDRAILTSAVKKLRSGNGAYFGYDIPANLARWLKRYSFSEIKSLADEIKKLVEYSAGVKNLETLANQILRMKTLHGDEGLALLRSILGHRKRSFSEHFDDLLGEVAKIPDEELLDTLTALQLLSEEKSKRAKKELLEQLLKDAPAGQRAEIARAIEIWSASLVGLEKLWLIEIARDIPEGRRLEVAKAILPLLEQFEPVRYLGDYGRDQANAMIDHLSQLYVKTGQEGLTLIEPLLTEQNGLEQVLFVRKVHQCLPFGDEGIEFFKDIRALIVDYDAYPKLFGVIRAMLPINFVMLPTGFVKELSEELHTVFGGMSGREQQQLLGVLFDNRYKTTLFKKAALVIRPSFTVKQRLEIIKKLASNFYIINLAEDLKKKMGDLEDAEAYKCLF